MGGGEGVTSSALTGRVTKKINQKITNKRKSFPGIDLSLTKSKFNASKKSLNDVIII